MSRKVEVLPPRGQIAGDTLQSFIFNFFMKIDIKEIFVKATKEMHVDFAKEVRKNEKRVNMWAWIALVAFLVQIIGEYFLHNKIVENIGQGAWLVAFVAFALYLSSLANKAKKATAMQHMIIDMLTIKHPEVFVEWAEKHSSEKTPKVEDIKPKAPRSRKVPVKSEK